MQSEVDKITFFMFRQMGINRSVRALLVLWLFNKFEISIFSPFIEIGLNHHASINFYRKHVNGKTNKHGREGCGSDF